MKALLEEYWKVKTIVAPRPTHTHSSTNHAVDTIWYFSFQNLSENAKAILSVLCLLSPDVTFLDIFLPQNQETLTSFLAFCRREAGSGANQSPQMRDAIEELLKSTLIRREARILSVHRVVQEAFFYVNRKERREAFRSAVKLVHNAFPKQINGRPLHHVWDRCDRYIQDAIFLATRYKDFQKINDPISAPSELCPLLMNAAWYLHEVSDHTENFKLLNIAYEVCGNEISLEYAHLRNTAGAIYFELNDLHSCRAAWEEALRIRSAQLDDRSEELANSINNLANLSVAEGSYELALEGFARAYEIRTNLGEELQLPLAITLIGRGRALLALGRYGEAAEANEEAQGLILSSGVPRTPFRAEYVQCAFPFHIPI